MIFKFHHIAATIALTAGLLGCSNGKETIKPVMKPLLEAVYASGFVISKDEYEIISQAEGYIAEKLVEPGDAVKRGDAIYIIESNQSSARLEIARETFALARKNYQSDSPVLAELAALVSSGRSKMEFDSLNFVRYVNLLERNATTQAEHDRMKLAYGNSRNEYLLQRSRYTRTKNQLSLELENARNQLAIASDESGRYIVRSEMDGTVFLADKEKGELIRRNEPVAVIGQREAFYLQLNVDEQDVSRIKKGQSVIVKIDAYPGKVFNGTIDKIYPMVDRRQQSVRADAVLKERLPAAFSGLAVEANIIIRQKDQAIVIPKSRLLPGDSVLIQTEKGDMKIKVQRGIETLDEVEIAEGLDTNSVLVNKN